MSQSQYELKTATSEVRYLLNNLKENPEVRDDEQAITLINYAIDEYNMLATSIDFLTSQLLSLGTELARVAPRDPNEQISADEYSFINKYKALKEYGCAPEIVNIIAISDGVDDPVRMKLLKHLYALSPTAVEEIVLSHSEQRR